jgi:hypothetical protein
VLTVVMVVENVLRLPHSEAITETGNGLYKALTACRLYLLTATWSEDDLTTWLHRRQLSGHQGILYAPAPGAAARIDTLRRVRSWRIGLVRSSTRRTCAIVRQKETPGDLSPLRRGRRQPPSEKTPLQRHGRSRLSLRLPAQNRPLHP